MTMHDAGADERDAGPLLLGAGIAIVLLPLMVLGLSAPLWVGAIASGLTLAATAILVRVRRSPAPTLPAPAQAATLDARDALARLEGARRDIGDRDVRATLDSMARSAHAIMDGVAADPGALGPVQRVLTYYLPRAAALAASYAVLEARADGPRLAAVRRVLEKLDAAFRWYADRFADDALKALDVELRLVDAALEDDLGGGGPR